MKPALEHLPKNPEESFVARFFDHAYYPTPWHFHPEYELVLVTESTGKRFIGDAISNFKPGNLVLLGPNLPHLYRNDIKYYQAKKNLRAKSIVIHFSDHSFGRDFLLLPEAKKIKQLFIKSLQGIEITGKANESVSKKMWELLEVKGFQKWIKLLEILGIVAELKQHHLISKNSVAGTNELESERMNSVLDFLLKNFSANITRADAAKVANLSENAFSRYFSQRTRKTFAGYVNELRLSHAAKLMVEKNKSIADICYESGFNNLSNFNRHFKKLYNTGPLSYRKTYWDKVR